MLLCITSSHRTAGFDLLEQLERRSETIGDALRERSDVAGSIALATCNRFETYLDVIGAGGTCEVDDILLTISRAAELSEAQLRAESVVLTGHHVAAHLFAVSSGLESVVVGEGEIAGQVRRALLAARERGTVTSDLERLFQNASRTSRGVKNSTGIASAGRSIVRLALDLASSRVTDWANARILLIGTGSYAGASLAALRDRGATSIRVYSRTGRAGAFAARHRIQAIPPDGLIDAVAAADVILTCSTAPTVILDRATLLAAGSIPGSLPRRLVIDLGLPRNVEEAACSLDGIELLDLQTISLHAPLAEFGAEADARALIGEAAAAFTSESADRQVEPALVALRSHVFDVLDGEIERARRRGDENGALEAALRHMAGVLLHVPSVRARELARVGDAGAFIRGANALFGIEADESCAARSDHPREAAS